MLNKMLSPFTSIISRLKYGQKFMLISLLFMIPVVILLYNLVSTQQAKIKFIQGEQVGVKQVGETMPFMLALQQHRGLVNGYLNGDRDAKTQIEAKQQELSKMMEQIENHFQEKNLPQTYEKWVSIKKDWNFIHISHDSLTAADSFDIHSKLVKQVDELIISSSDETGLSLDSDIDSHYMMKLIVEELPDLIEGSAVIRGRGNGVLASKTLTNDINCSYFSNQPKARKR